MAEPKAKSDSGEMADGRSLQDIAKYWHNQLELAEKDHKSWRDDGRKVVERYKSEKDKARSGSKRYNILYGNTEVLLSALYGKTASPDVRRRFNTNDPIGQQAAEIIEQALVYCQDTYDTDKPIQAALQDYLLPGRGVVRIDYEPIFGTDPQTGQEMVVDQVIHETYVYWQDFLMMPARTWADIAKNGWVSFRHTMRRSELVEAFGEEMGPRVPLNWTPDVADKKSLGEELKKAEVFEVWDITERKRTWIVKGFPEPLRIDDDPYGLEQFFPIPEPIAYYSTTSTIVPEPEFHVYKDQADELDEITNRIARLTRALKRRGVYDQSIKELARLANANDNVFIPVENYQALATKGGLAASFQSEDIKVIAEVLIQLYQQRDMLVKAIWELVGLADIMRGSSDSNETLGAQELKAQFGSQRLKRRQRAIQKWIRDLNRIKAEIIAEHFEPQVLQQMTGQEIPPEIMQILRTDKLRGYRIDIETDSTVFEDAEAEKKSRSEMITAITAFLTAMGPMVQQAPQLGPLTFELLKFGVGGFKATRPIEDAIEQLAQQTEQAAQQPPPPNPEMMKVQGQLQLEQQKAQQQAQLEQQKAAMEQQRAQQQMQLEQQKAEHEMALKEREHAHQQQLDQQRLAHDAQRGEQEMALKQQSGEQDMVLKQRTAENSMDIATRQHELERDVKMAPAKATSDAVSQIISEGLQPILEGQDKLSEVVGQMAEQTKQLLQALAQTVQQGNQQVIAAVKQSSGPRKRTLVRGSDGKATHAIDEPMMMQ